MQFPVQITFDNLEPSPALETVVREHAAKLERFFDHIMACHVTIDAPHRHQHQGKLYAVRIDLTVPGRSWPCVTRSPRTTLTKIRESPCATRSTRPAGSWRITRAAAGRT